MSTSSLNKLSWWKVVQVVLITLGLVFGWLFALCVISIMLMNFGSPLQWAVETPNILLMFHGFLMLILVITVLGVYYISKSSPGKHHNNYLQGRRFLDSLCNIMALLPTLLVAYHSKAAFLSGGYCNTHIGLILILFSVKYFSKFYSTVCEYILKCLLDRKFRHSDVDFGVFLVTS